MKLTKILAIALASVVAFASCGPQQVEATGDAAVGFASETLEYGLGSEYIKIPIVTTGETSVYPIKVTVDVAAYSGDFAAVEDVDYMITSKEIFVASAESQPSVEVKIVNPTDADELRFALQITEQDNAQSISVKNATVVCKKSDLDRICGKWTAVGTDTYEGAAFKETWQFFTDAGQLYLTGLFGETAGAIACEFKDGKITWEFGQVGNALNAYNFNGIGTHYIVPIGGLVAGGKLKTQKEGKVTGTVSADFSTIVWDIQKTYGTGVGIALGLYSYPAGAPTSYFYAGPYVLQNDTMTKIPKNAK